ncbi:CRISPR-associated protein Cas4 [Haloarcula nitratireducens]|uniref:CRISPR-associated exonuclease Cas4 n=1 Tax=Haloarcula nitratireducens TaxID=2487749 RepID=A0AAW4PEM7_9EURY|nr:CRISPR-associated protein Cas4 [Halomicroarcula nitratireducens]MBX0296796.1 CRISPR-associated protein Cas4 [Halomicroarcula nitratireducens]
MTEDDTAPDRTADDPVERLLRSARNEAVDDSFHVTGVMMQYYEVCKRELWFASRHLEIDRDNAAVVRGTQVDDSAYEDERRNISVDGTIAIDVLEDGRVMEVKPSSSLVEPAKLQLLYYLWYLDRVVGVDRDGVLAHPTERKREDVELTDANVDRVENAIRGIHDVVTSDSPPPAEEKPFCDSCAYHDFCWSC